MKGEVERKEEVIKTMEAALEQLKDQSAKEKNAAQLRVNELVHLKK